MRQLLGFLVLSLALAWPGLVLGEEYVFGQDNSAGVYGASAGDSGKTGFYIAPRFLDALTNTGDINGSGRNSKTYNTLGGALAAGYELKHLDARLPVRVELEYAMRGDVDAEWSRSGSAGARKFDALFNVQTLQMNAYWDFETSTPFTPFIGGGMGMSFIYADYKVENERSSDNYNTSFAWNVGAGVGYDINESIAVDLAYRFAGYGYAKADTPQGKIENYMTANEFLLGMRLKF